MLYPYKFKPILAERVWGGRALEKFGKTLPPGKSIGESWEISDRDDAQSVVANGPDAGKTLRQLIEEHGDRLLGTNVRSPGFQPGSAVGRDGQDARATLRFPLLIKLLDARERLSLQVHPPASVAGQLGGKPKTEMWYILDAASDAHLIAGLKRGVTRETFTCALQQSAIRNPQSAIEPLVHRFPVNPGDALFVPSGRLHAIDAGLVIAEIQQSSDTTYRVFDWGRPRQLHVKESLASIDFTDFEPAKIQPRLESRGGNGRWRLVECDHFHVEKLELEESWEDRCDGTTFHILGGVRGRTGIVTPAGQQEYLNPGEWALLPATLGYYALTPETETDHVELLRATVPSPSPS